MRVIRRFDLLFSLYDASGHTEHYVRCDIKAKAFLQLKLTKGVSYIRKIDIVTML